MKNVKNNFLILICILVQSIIYSQNNTEIWLQSKLKGSAIGYTYFSHSSTDILNTSVVENNMVLNRLNNKVEIYSKNTIEENVEGGIIAMDHELKVSTQKTLSKILIKGQEIHITMNSAGKEFTKTLPFDGKLMGPHELKTLSIKKLKNVGDILSYQTYFPDYGKVYTAQRKVQEIVDGNIIFSEEIKGLPKIYFTMDNYGNIIGQKYDTPFGPIESIQSTKEKSLKAINETVILPNEIFDQTMARNNVRFSNPRSIEEITIKISAIDKNKKIPNLGGENQEVIEKTDDYVILKITQPKLSRDVMINNGQNITNEFVKSNAMINSSDPRIVKVANEVGSDDVYDNLVSLRNWVSDNMKFDLGIVMAPASEIIENKKGTCTEYATILTSLYRAKNIPSRVAMGFVYMGGVWAGHAWPEVYLEDKWVPFDAALPGNGIADAARFRFVSSSLENGIGDFNGLEGGLLYGNVKIETISYKEANQFYNVKDNKAYLVNDHRYINPGLRIKVDKSEDSSFEHLENVWPKTKILTVSGEKGKMELFEHSIKPNQTVEKVILNRIQKITGNKVKQNRGLYTSKSKDGQTIVKIKPLNNGYIMAKYTGEKVSNFAKKTKVNFY